MTPTLVTPPLLRIPRDNSKYTTRLTHSIYRKIPYPPYRSLFQGSGWLTRGGMYLVKINGTPGETETPTWLPNATHSVLVVNEESAIASPDPQPEPAEEGEAATQADDEDEAPLREAVTREAPGVKMEEENVLASEAPEYESPPPWSIEAISICFAMDVPRTALLVTPAAHPIHRFIKELNGYGVDARPLDMLSPVAVKMSIPNDKCTETTADGESPDPPSQTHEVSISRTFPTSS